MTDKQAAIKQAGAYIRKQNHEITQLKIDLRVATTLLGYTKETKNWQAYLNDKEKVNEAS